MKRLTLIAAALLWTAGCASSSEEDVDSAEGAWTTAQPVPNVTDFLSGGQFGCEARNRGGWTARISMNVGVPRKNRDQWFASGDFRVERDTGGGSVTWSAQNRGRPVQSVTGKPGVGAAVTIRSGWGGVQCSWTKSQTGPDGQPFDDVFEGRVVRFSPEGDCFDERFYLQSQPDIAQVVAKNEWLSGRMHYEEFGRNEGRAGCAPR